jgi:hypothetical protein
VRRKSKGEEKEPREEKRSRVSVRRSRERKEGEE